MAVTTNYSWVKPTVGGDNSTWGTILNTAWDDADADLKAVSDVAAAAVPKAGGTMTGKLVLDGAETTYASLNIPDATADPTAPNNGDIWHEANLLKAHLNGVTQTLANLTSLPSMDVTGGASGEMQIGTLYVKWGAATVTPAASGTTGEATVTFSNAFPTACSGIWSSPNLPSGAISSSSYTPYVRSLSAASAILGLDSTGTPHTATTCYWFALGY